MNENDRKLLAFAAKAAGAIWHQHMLTAEWRLNGHTWNPLADDGDALRLAVTCSIDIELTVDQAEAWYVYPMPGLDNDQVRSIVKVFDADPNAATRRAIVGAAAEIGKTWRKE